MLIGVNSFALKGNHKGVPSIGSMVIMSGLENPWDLSFYKGYESYVLYREVKGLSVNVGGSTHKLVGIKGSEGYATKMDDLFTYGGQEGMLGIVLDNNFDKNRTLYLYSASSNTWVGCKKDNYASCHGNIVMKMTVAKTMKSVSNRVDIVKDIQFKPI